MKAVSVSELKARLSHYLRVVKRGGEVQIVERGTPIARLVGLEASAESGDDRLERLIKAGVVRPGTGDPRAVLKMPPLKVPFSLSETIIEDREDRF